MLSWHPSRIVYHIRWSLLGLALAGLSLAGCHSTRGVKWLRWSTGGRYSTSDRYLNVLGITDPSEAVLAALAEVPPEQAIIFVGPGNDPDSHQSFMVVSYLGWPRPIGWVRCGGVGQASAFEVRPPAGARVGGLLFFRASRMTGRAIGPHLTLVRVGEAGTWTSYCAPPRS